MSTNKLKPMKSETLDLEKDWDRYGDEIAKHTWLLSPKIDGVRVRVISGVAYSNSGKAFPNIHLQAAIKSLFGNNEVVYEGELCVGSSTAEDLCAKTSGFVNSNENLPAEDVTLELFDVVTGHQFSDRFSIIEKRHEHLSAILTTLGLPKELQHEKWRNYTHTISRGDPFSGTGSVLFVTPIIRSTVISPESIIAYYRANPIPHVPPWTHAEIMWLMIDKIVKATLKEGYEGVMMKRADSMYKHGRATKKECTFFKIKPMQDAEATIEGYTQKMVAINGSKVDELGYLKTNKKKEDLQAVDELGALMVVNAKGQRFSVGSGFTAEERVRLWQERDSLIGRVITYKYLPVGEKEAPRHPTFKCFRGIE